MNYICYDKTHSYYGVNINMRIGKLANSVGCHVETIRYYEKIGLLTAAKRNPNGYRKYTISHLEQLRLIRKARSLGFSQDDVRNLVHLNESQTNPCEHVHKMTLQQIENITQKIIEMQKMKLALQQLALKCERKNDDCCPALATLSQSQPNE